VALLSAARGLVPPTANLTRCDLPVDVVAGEPRRIEPAPALSTSFAFGGHNATLIVGPPPADGSGGGGEAGTAEASSPGGEAGRG
jgi:3-oxoacyl-(acyl-carrier-protein) synthase